MSYIEFPKALYRNETEREPSKVVNNWDEQLQAEAEGWVDITPKETQQRPEPEEAESAEPEPKRRGPKPKG